MRWTRVKERMRVGEFMRGIFVAGWSRGVGGGR